MAKNEIQVLEEITFLEDDSFELPPPEIVAYNELRSCADLFRMHVQGILEIQPEFQREIVWKKPDQTRFIDSLIKQLPIPSMCFSYDSERQKWQVIDGLQRMATIVRFLAGEGTLSKLDDVDPRISGKNVSEFQNPDSELNQFFTRVENLTLPITVIRCDYSKKNHTNYLFTIFHRLNSGGMRLNNQEIRNCIYSGPFNDKLHELNQLEAWRRINRMKADVGYRFMKEELILRMFAFADGYRKYNGKLAKFLNDYMNSHRYASGEFLQQKQILFQRSVSLIYEKMFSGKIPPKLSTTLLETTLVGVALNIDSLERVSTGVIKSLYKTLVKHPEFSESNIREGLARTSRVKARIEAAERIFAGE